MVIFTMDQKLAKKSWEIFWLGHPGVALEYHLIDCGSLAVGPNIAIWYGAL